MAIFAESADNSFLCTGANCIRTEMRFAGREKSAVHPDAHVRIRDFPLHVAASPLPHCLQAATRAGSTSTTMTHRLQLVRISRRLCTTQAACHERVTPRLSALDERLEAERAARAPLATEEYLEASAKLRAQLLGSKRRVHGSPILSMERVAVSGEVQRAVETGLSESGLSARTIRKKSLRGETVRAKESQHKFVARRKLRGNARVLLPPEYHKQDCALSYIAIRAPATLAAAVHVFTELKRITPAFTPKTALDFGAGIAAATSAVARVFKSETPTEEEETATTSLQSVTLVEKSRELRRLGDRIFGADPNVKTVEHVSWVSALREVGKMDNVKDCFDLVLSSYTLSEIARNVMASMPGENEEAVREARAKRAEKELKSVVKSLWTRTAPGGCLTVIEDGTAAGFETIVFAREVIRRLGGRVVAPCMHSEKCPLDGSITRHRVCRFVQRLNRPLYLRIAKPMPDGFEDEYFSYVVIQKPLDGQLEAEQQGWGRVVRPPMLRGGHVVLDACAKEGVLERRVVTRSNSPPGMYNIARKARLGDIWPVKPKSNVQKVNF